MLLCGILTFTATDRCYAQDTGALLNVKIPQVKESPAYLPDVSTIPSRGPLSEGSVPKVSDTPWYWRLFGGLAFGLAKVNTEKQNDGRPQPVANPW